MAPASVAQRRNGKPPLNDAAGTGGLTHPATGRVIIFANINNLVYETAYITVVGEKL